MPNRSRIVVVDTKDVYDNAIRQRRRFFGKDASNRVKVEAPWPEELVHIGKCVAVIYESNKELSGGRWEIYKHIAEAGQDLFINPVNTRLLDRSGNEVEFQITSVSKEFPWAKEPTSMRLAANPDGTIVRGCTLYEIEGAMPRYVSVLAEDRGLQAVLHGGAYYEIRMPKAEWGSGVHPETEETFLVMYSSEGVHFLVTGDELDITEDGIVG